MFSLVGIVIIPTIKLRHSTERQEYAQYIHSILRITSSHSLSVGEQKNKLEKQAPSNEYSVIVDSALAHLTRVVGDQLSHYSTYTSPLLLLTHVGNSIADQITTPA